MIPIPNSIVNIIEMIYMTIYEHEILVTLTVNKISIRDPNITRKLAMTRFKFVNQLILNICFIS